MVGGVEFDKETEPAATLPPIFISLFLAFSEEKKKKKGWEL